MHRVVIALALIGLLLASANSNGQHFPTPYVPSAHSATGTSTTFQFDIPSTSLVDSTMTHQLVYRDTTSLGWIHTVMAELYQSCTTSTYSAAINFTPPSGTMEWYFRSEGDTVVISMSPKNSANTFPLPSHMMADMGSDSVGDAVGATGPYLDLTGMQMGYSDTKIYARITNVSGGYPTNSGTTFFLYGVGVINPDETDSVGYAMIYVNVPFIMTSGLYRINPVDTSFSKIGNISTNISGTALSMSCNISDLTAQPGWGVWPPPSGFILTAPMTATQTLSGFTTNDVGKGGVFLPSSHIIHFGGSNAAPTLTGVSIVASPPDTVKAQVTYTDANKDLPVLRELYFGAQVYLMTACEKSYGSGAVFGMELTTGTSGWFQYHFRFSDGRDTVTTPVDSLHVVIPVRGDADGSGSIDISDVVFLISYIFSGGPSPNPLFTGDANCDGAVDISDAVYLIAYIFSGGPAPCK